MSYNWNLSACNNNKNNMLLFHEMKIITIISVPSLMEMQGSKQFAKFYNSMTVSIILLHYDSNITLSSLCIIVNSLDNSFLYYFQ